MDWELGRVSDRSPILPIAVLSVGLVVVAGLVTADWSQRRLIAELAESIVAVACHLTMLFAPIVVAVLVYKRVKERAGKAWLGVIPALVILIALAISLQYAFRAIPGIGWRLDRLSTQPDP